MRKIQGAILTLFFVISILLLPSTAYALRAYSDGDDTIVFRSAYRAMKWSTNEWYYLGKSIRKDETAICWIRLELTGRNATKLRFKDTAELQVDNQHFILKYVQDSDKVTFLGTTDEKYVAIGSYIVSADALEAIKKCKQQIVVKYSFENLDAQPVVFSVPEEIGKEWIKITGMTRKDYDKQ